MVLEYKNYTVQFVKSLFQFEEMVVKKYDFLFNTGDLNDYIYFNVAGKIKISKGKIILGYAERGEFVGITSCLCHSEKYFFSAQACEDTVLLKIQKSDFENALKDNPEFGKMMINILCERLKWVEGVYC